MAGKKKKQQSSPPDLSSIHNLLEGDKNRRRAESVINKLLDDWWDNNPDSYEELWEEGRSGSLMLSELEQEYPEFYDSILRRNMLWIYKQYEG